MKYHSPVSSRLPVRITLICSLVAMGFGLFAFLGWITAIPWLTALWPGGIPMAPSTALLFLLFGVVLLPAIYLPKTSVILRFSGLIAWVATCISILLLVLASLGITLQAEYLGMNISGMVGGAPIGHMSPLTALCFILIGISFLLQHHKGKRLLVSFWLAACVFLASIILIIGYLVGAPLLYETGIIPPAMTTSLAFLILSVGLLSFVGVEIWPYESPYDDTSAQATVILSLVFMLLVTGILSVGYLYSRNLQKHFYKQAETELVTIADLKIGELHHWHEERFRDASFFYKNYAFSDLVSRFLADSDGMGGHDRLQVWLQNFQKNSNYDRVYLTDARGNELFSVPERKKIGEKSKEADYLQIVQSRQITFLDFHRDPPDQKVHLDIAVPILSGSSWEKLLGILIFQMDPQRYLYPLISRWPVPRQTAETLLVRRDGNDVLFLNELRFQKDAAFTMRRPLKETNLPAAQAVQGRKGIVQGRDYRGVPVLADLRAVPNSPWYIVAKMDLGEVNRPLYERQFWITGLMGALLLGTGSVVGFIWRNQRAQFYRLRYMAARAVEDSEKRLMTIFDNAKDGIMVADAESKQFLTVNKAIVEMLGYSREKLLTLGVQDIHPEADLPAIIETFRRQALGNFSIAADVPMQRMDGSIFYADINTTPIEFGGRPCLLGTFRDVTDRMQAEARIERLNRVLRSIRNINQLIVRAEVADDLTGRACDLLVDQGSYVSALIVLTDVDGKMIGHWEAGVGEDFRLLVDQMNRGEVPACCKAADFVEGVCLISGQDNICSECVIAGSCISPQKMSMCLKHQDRVYGYLSVSLGLDIAMDAEEERLFVELAGDLAYSLHNIEVKAAMQTAEKETKQLEAQLFQAQKMEAVGQLAGGIAHDFNNLLTIILGYSQMLGEEGGISSTVGEALKEIHEAAIRAKNLTRQLLAFSRKQMLDMRRVDVNKVIIGFDSLLRRTIGEDIQMALVLTQELAWVKADISQLEQILMNLAVNARDAMPDGGVLTIETAVVDLDESYVASKLGAIPGTHVMISVSDNGVGMDHESVQKIFEPFYTTKPVGRGTGLGLSTVYGVVKQHGGNIWVYSEPGQGTTFKIYFPAVEKETIEEEYKQTMPEPSVKDRTVLVVEDEPSLMKLACRILRRSGYQVYEAVDVEDALEIARTCSDPIHLLLTDVIMPKMKGTEVYKKVSEYHPESRVLYMSGYTENVIARQGILKEGIHFLQKPFSAKSLLDKVLETLAG